MESLQQNIDEYTQMREQLLTEMRNLRHHIAELKASESDRRLAQEALVDSESRYEELTARMTETLSTLERERKRAQEALLESERKYGLLSEHMTDTLSVLEGKRKQAQQELQSTEQRYNELAVRLSEGLSLIDTLVESVTDGLAIVDTEGLLSYANTPFCRMLSYNPEEILGRNASDWVGPAYRDTFASRVRGESQGGSATFDATWLAKNGHEVLTTVTVHPIVDARGSFKGSFAVMRWKNGSGRAEAQALRDAEHEWADAFREIRQGKTCLLSDIFDHLDFDADNDYNVVLRKYLSNEHIDLFDARREKEKLVQLLTEANQRKRADKLIRGMVQKLINTLDGTVHALSTLVEQRDRYTSGHQRRVASLACAIAEKLNLSKDCIDGIHVASLLHDLGKVSVPTEILTKPGRLTDIEFGMIKTHPQVGYDILKKIEFPWPVARIVWEHHERMNGSGYPRGLVNEEILMDARIVGVADVVESMSSHRPYRSALGVDKALEELSAGRGTEFDPDVVDACLQVFEKGFDFDTDAVDPMLSCLRKT